MPWRFPRLSAALLALLLAGGLGACGDDDDEGDGAASTTTTEATGSGTTEEDATTTTAGAGGSSTTAAPGSTTTTTASDGATSTAPPSGSQTDGVIEVAIVGGDVQGGVRREKVALNSEVTIRATSDVADELHVHTYDLKVALVPGRAADLTFLARIPGVFEVELEERGKKVLELEVSR